MRTLIWGFVGAGTVCAFMVWILNSRTYWKAEGQRWKDSTVNYRGQTIRLRTDSTAFRGIITTLKKQATDAQNISMDYKSKFNNALTKSDIYVDQLSAKQQRISYLLALVRNGTLAVTDTVYVEKVLTAGLKTAGREKVASNAVDSLTKSLGYISEENERLRSGFGKLTKVSNRIRERKKGGIWPLNAKRRKQLTESANEISELETELNQ